MKPTPSFVLSILLVEVPRCRAKIAKVRKERQVTNPTAAETPRCPSASRLPGLCAGARGSRLEKRLSPEPSQVFLRCSSPDAPRSLQSRLEIVRSGQLELRASCRVTIRCE